MSFVDGLRAELDREMGATRRLLERVPEERLEWRPQTGARTVGELIAHLSALGRWGDAVMGADAFDLGEPRHESPVASIAEALARFDAGVARARAALTGRIDAELQAPVTITERRQEVFTAPRLVAFRLLFLNHVIHHRGQLSAYLRLCGVDPPAVYGPYADDRA
jgi:uncharacterized damage-inducible protein DinB